ncbi:PREDICTED: probable inactive receptor kinase At2g26730 isoform X2 [Populus euphratica]|uniref:Probable inactive receptor kinase At2g26730 isoform X2 n=1 Tax=Populus euphratica TaxID=75702 RepID=A0AAJ6UUZ4_POPEU|nr:PREDICTED: probable inactive receptor kinase At2g26730 isoform X2 [Populus euphratica]
MIMNLAAVTTYVVLFALYIAPMSVHSLYQSKEFFPEEREALMQIRDSVSSTLDLHGNWTGPPCHKNSSQWSGISCSNWHVVGLVLEGVQLTGSLPPAFLQNITFLANLSFRNNSIYGPLPNLSNLVHLESVFFSYNRLTGSIPSEYIELPNLKQLELQQNYLNGEIPPFNQPTLTLFNVSYNHLQGSIPDTDVLRRFSESSYDHNSNLCGIPLEPCPVPPPAPLVPPPSPPVSPPQNKKRKLPIWIIALIVVVVALVPLMVMFVFLCCYKKAQEVETPKERQAGDDSSPEWTDKKMPHSQGTEDPERRIELQFFDKNIPVFDLDDLLRASAEVLGKGKLGTTYSANLESGAVVAVKRVKYMNSLSKKEFIQQMLLLGRMRHENLVHIISFYYSKQEKLIVYEFVPDGSLFELLHENREAGRIPLNWAARLSIIKDIAKGMAFLHQSLPSHKVPHANLKSSNVLIHRDRQSYHSKLTNYSFLPLLPSRKSSGRLAIGRSPEFCQGKKLTHKADVYCFGIILLEVITGKIPEETSPAGNEEKVDDLSEWVRMVVNNDWSTDILDVEILASSAGHNEMLKLTEIALQCTDMEPEKRPKMSEVLRRIEEIDRTNQEND